MDKLEQYISDMSSPQGDLLHELERETYLRVINPRMISGHIQGKTLEMLVRMLRPRRILEIGTFTGYSALSMAKRQFVAQLAIINEGAEGYMLGVGRSLLVHGEVDTLEEAYRKIGAVTAEQIMEVANEIWTNPSTLTYI
jgi:predicted Zn-dependent peptidase